MVCSFLVYDERNLVFSCIDLLSKQYQTANIVVNVLKSHMIFFSQLRFHKYTIHLSFATQSFIHLKKEFSQRYTEEQMRFHKEFYQRHQSAVTHSVCFARPNLILQKQEAFPVSRVIHNKLKYFLKLYSQFLKLYSYFLKLYSYFHALFSRDFFQAFTLSWPQSITQSDAPAPSNGGKWELTYRT